MRRDLPGRIGLLCGVALCVALSGCGLVGGGDGESAQLLTIGTAVTTTTTTAVDPAGGTRADDSGEFYRKLAERMETTGAADPQSTGDGSTTSTETSAPAEPYCLELERFVFESTQMFLAEDVPATIERHRAAIAAIDQALVDAPETVAQPARQVRQLYTAAIAPPAATASVESLHGALRSMAADNATLIDGLLTTAIAECEASMSDPLRSVSEGLALLDG